MADITEEPSWRGFDRCCGAVVEGVVQGPNLNHRGRSWMHWKALWTLFRVLGANAIFWKPTNSSLC